MYDVLFLTIGKRRSLTHAVVVEDGNKSGASLCGLWPQEWGEKQEGVTCHRCAAKLRKLRARKVDLHEPFNGPE